MITMFRYLLLFQVVIFYNKCYTQNRIESSKWKFIGDTLNFNILTEDTIPLRNIKFSKDSMRYNPTFTFYEGILSVKKYYEIDIFVNADSSYSLKSKFTIDDYVFIIDEVNKIIGVSNEKINLLFKYLFYKDDLVLIKLKSNKLNGRDSVFLFDCMSIPTDFNTVKILAYFPNCSVKNINQDNKIYKKLSDSLGLFENLEVLVIHIKAPTILPETLEKTSKLKCIEISSPLTNYTFPTGIKLMQLEAISFDSLMITEFPKELYNFPKLRLISFYYSPRESKEFRNFIVGLLKIPSLVDINISLPLSEDKKRIKNRRTKTDIRWAEKKLKKKNISVEIF